LIARSRAAYVKKTVTTLAANAMAFRGECFRCVTPKYSSAADIFSGSGSKFASGRYHVKGEFTAVYASTRVEWAYDEYRNTARNNNISDAKLLPVTLVAARISLSRVLDLTDVTTQAALQVTEDELVHSKWTSKSESITQLIGQTCNEAGFDGIIVPSANERKNIIILIDNASRSSAVRIVNANRLPSNP
jgi:filamentous hemagglutinin